MPIYLTYFIQILLVIHVLKTGRDRYWIWLLLFLPLIGGVAYLVVEILPGFSSGITGQRTRRSVRNLVDPGADVRELAAAWDQSSNADNGRHYAQALLAADRAGEAEEILDQVLVGLFKTDPALLLLKAQAQFDQEHWEPSLVTLEDMQKHNPKLRSPEGHLMYARALEKTGRNDEAITEYRAVASYFPGAQARFLLGLALKKSGQTNEASEKFRGMIRDAELAPAHFRKSEKHWLNLAGKELADLLNQLESDSP
jgi:hypothetical protein